MLYLNPATLGGPDSSADLTVSIIDRDCRLKLHGGIGAVF